ncbi:MAG: flagellar motor switch protein FliN [bacterium]|jgi:flagellar motor switch protein FliN/FliY
MEDKNQGNVPADAMPQEEPLQNMPPQEPVPTPEEEEPVAEPRESMLSQESIDNVLKDIADGKVSEEGEMPRPVARKADFQQLSSSREPRPPQNIELLMDVDLPVSIELGRTKMSISDILALGPGSVVELDKLVGEPVDLLVNQKCVARGEVVVVEENFGLRITHLMPPEERIKNLR